jgi:hypothetical protein
MTEHNMDHMNFLGAVAVADVEELRRKEKTYGGSWKKRGGTGAYHVSIRVVDRLQKIVEEEFNCDIFAAIEDDPSGADGSALAQIRDYRRYLMLIESEMMAKGIIEDPAKEKTEAPCGGKVGSQLPNGAVVGCKIGEMECDCDGDPLCKNHPDYKHVDPFQAEDGKP